MILLGESTFNLVDLVDQVLGLSGVCLDEDKFFEVSEPFSDRFHFICNNNILCNMKYLVYLACVFQIGSIRIQVHKSKCKGKNCVNDDRYDYEPIIIRDSSKY